MSFLALAMFFSLVGGVGYSFLSLQGQYINGTYPNIAYTAALFSFALAGFYQLRALSRPTFEEGESINVTNPTVNNGINNIFDDPVRFSFLSYFSIGAGYGMLFLVAYSQQTVIDDSLLGGMILKAAALTGFVIARQVLTVRENTRLHAEQVQNLSEKRFRSLVQNSFDRRGRITNH